MQKQWVILYVKPNKEFTVANFLTRKNIDNFCPANTVGSVSINSDRSIRTPLFPSQVFACLDRMETLYVRKLNYVYSIFHLKDRPATVSENEINTIRDFTTRYSDISVKEMSTDINPENELHTLFESIHLPSLGISMMAPVSAQKTNIEKTFFPGAVLRKLQMNIFNF